MLDILIKNKQTFVRQRPPEPPSGAADIYLIYCIGTNLYKIGQSSDVKQRLTALQISCPLRLKLIISKTFNCPHRAEILLHRMFADKRKSGEWFELDDKELVNIKRLLA